MKFVCLLAALALLPAAVVLKSRVVIIPAEIRTTVHVGDTVVIPLYDAKGQPSVYGNNLKKLGVRAISAQDSAKLRKETWRLPSPRGVAYLATAAGPASAGLLLTLPQLKEVCVSCRYAHYFITVLPK